MLAVIGILFNGDYFSDWGLAFALAGTFFFASAGASSAYLTVSEVFPMEIRRARDRVLLRRSVPRSAGSLDHSCSRSSASPGTRAR